MTTPDVFTVAIAVLPLLHTPPATVSVYVVAEPIQMLVGPVMVPADGNELELAVIVATAVEQLAATV